MSNKDKLVYFTKVKEAKNQRDFLKLEVFNLSKVPDKFKRFKIISNNKLDEIIKEINSLGRFDKAYVYLTQDTNTKKDKYIILKQRNYIPPLWIFLVTLMSILVIFYFFMFTDLNVDSYEYKIATTYNDLQSTIKQINIEKQIPVNNVKQILKELIDGKETFFDKEVFLLCYDDNREDYLFILFYIDKHGNIPGKGLDYFGPTKFSDIDDSFNKYPLIYKIEERK